MKYLTISLLFIIGCNKTLESPKYKVGDCLKDAKDRDLERWQQPKDTSIYQIEEVGREHYLLIVVCSKYLKGYHYTESFNLDDDPQYRMKVVCPK